MVKMGQSGIDISINNDILRICKNRKRQNESDIEEINLIELIDNRVYGSYVKITKKEEMNTIFFFEKYELSNEEKSEKVDKKN